MGHLDPELLRRLQRAVGGCVDVVRLAPGLDMWVNDAGMVEGLPVNPVATALARRHGLTHQPYFGPVVLTGGADREGRTLGLSEDDARRLAGWALADWMVLLMGTN